MAAEGAAVAGGGVLGGRLAKDSLRQSKCPDSAPNRRRGSAQSQDAQRRAYQWCREYLGGAWRRLRPEELRVHPVRWAVRGGPGAEGRLWPSRAHCFCGAGPGARTRGQAGGSAGG